jgi:hypothetical protein
VVILSRKKKTLDELAKEAIIKHQRLLHDKVLELVLGDMIALNGVKATREKLKWWYDHLREFEK